MDKEALSGLLKLLTTRNSPNIPKIKKDKIQLLYFIEWIVYLIILSRLLRDYRFWIDVSILVLFIPIFFLIAHIFLFKFPLKSKSIKIFSILSFILLISIISLFLLLLLGLDIFIILGLFFYVPVIIAAISLPFWIASLIQILKYRKALKIQSLDQANETKKTN